MHDDMHDHDMHDGYDRVKDDDGSIDRVMDDRESEVRFWEQERINSVMAVRFGSFSRLALIGTSASGILWSSSSEAHHGVGVKPSSVLGARRQSGLEAFGSKYFRRCASC